MVFGGDDRVGGGHHLSNNLCSVCTEWLDYLANLSCDLSGCDGNVDRSAPARPYGAGDIHPFDVMSDRHGYAVEGV